MLVFLWTLAGCFIVCYCWCCLHCQLMCTSQIWFVSIVPLWILLLVLWSLASLPSTLPGRTSLTYTYVCTDSDCLSGNLSMSVCVCVHNNKGHQQKSDNNPSVVQWSLRRQVNISKYAQAQLALCLYVWVCVCVRYRRVALLTHIRSHWQLAKRFCAWGYGNIFKRNSNTCWQNLN